MKKLIAIGIFFCSYHVNAQTSYYSKRSDDNYDCNRIIKSVSGKIEIETGKITISNFLDGGTKPLILTVDSVESKDYLYSPATWYHCQGDGRFDIFIVQGKKKYLFDFADEVTVFQYQFY